MTNHKPTYTTSTYPGSNLTYRIVIQCSCGTRRTLTDGTTAPTMKRATAAFKAHVEKAKVDASTETVPFVATRIQLPDVPVAPAPLPEGWDAALMAAVETGRVSYRRALRIAGAR